MYIMDLIFCRLFIVKISLNNKISRPVFFNIDYIYSSLYLTFNLQEKNYAEKNSPSSRMETSVTVGHRAGRCRVTGGRAGRALESMLAVDRWRLYIGMV